MIPITWGELRDYVQQVMSRVARYAPTVKSSASGHGDAVAGRSEPDEPQNQYTVRRLWPFGLRSRPPVGVEALILHVNGGSANGVMVGAESGAYGPSDLEEGDVALYCLAENALWKLTKLGEVIGQSADGKDITITATGSGKASLVGSVVRLGSATDGDLTPAARSDNVASRLEALESRMTTISTHTHPVSGSATLASAALSSLPITSPPTVESSNVKVKK